MTVSIINNYCTIDFPLLIKYIAGSSMIVPAKIILFPSLQEGDYLTFRVNPLMASAGRQEDSLYVEVDDSYTADPRDITLPDISTDKSRDIVSCLACSVLQCTKKLELIIIIITVCLVISCCFPVSSLVRCLILTTALVMVAWPSLMLMLSFLTLL